MSAQVKRILDQSVRSTPVVVKDESSNTQDIPQVHHDSRFAIWIVLILSLAMTIAGITLLQGTAGLAITVSGLVLTCEAGTVLKRQVGQ